MNTLISLVLNLELPFCELLNIAEQNGRLIFQRPNGAIYNLNYAGNNDFFFDKDFLRVNFMSDPAGKIKSLKFSKVDIGVTEWFRTQKPLLKLAPEKVADSLLKQYQGTYFLPGSDTISITQDGPGLYYQINAQQKQLLAPENNTLFFSLKEDLHFKFIKDTLASTWGLLLVQGNKNKKYLKL